MAEIKINDIEILNKKKKNILELQRKIEELQEVKEVKKLQQEEIELKNKIKKYSTYDSVLIGNIIAKLMTAFEGIEYCCSKNSVAFFLDCNYCIDPKSNNRDNIYIYPNYQIKNIKQDRHFFDTSEKQEMCYLPPSSFRSNTSSQHNARNNDIEYIQLFIDYLYERRSSKSLLEISEINLEEILQEFLEITNDIQQKRKTEIADKIETRIKQQKRKEYEKSCVIDRKLIYNSLSYIINHYESGMVAKKQADEEFPYGYHKLIIEYDDKQIIYSALVDKIDCYPDEEYCFLGYHMDIDKDTNIPFFDIKNKLFPIINNSTYVKVFMDMIENLYSESKDITADNIQEFLILISNENKAKQRVLKN